jgi:hypothetical protein
MSVEEWAERQTREEEFKHIAKGCTHLGPRSARRAIPYPPLLTASYATVEPTTSLFESPLLVGEELPLPNGLEFAWE